MRKTQVIVVPRSDVECAERLLTNEPKNEGEWFSDKESPFVYSAKFDDEFVVDVKICGTSTFEEGTSNLPWTEAVLYAPNFDDDGRVASLCEVCCSDGSDEFFGIWELENGDDVYVVIVVGEPEALKMAEKEKVEEKKKIVSDEIYSPQAYLEKMTGNYYIVPNDPINDVKFIEDILDEQFGEGTYWSHALSDIDEINSPVVLVECLVENENGEIKTVLRWFEVNEEG